MVRVLACCCLGVCCYAHACMILITSIITGPHQYPEKMIPKFINQLMNGKKLTVVRIFSFFFLVISPASIVGCASFFHVGYPITFLT